MALAKAINLGGVNCYLLSAAEGFVLIDTGFRGKRAQLENALERAGCVPGKLKLIVLTHGDSDHADNCAYFRKKYGCPVAMHGLDSGMVEKGDMGWNRKPRADRYSLMFRLIGLVARLVSGGSKFERFTPDILIDELFDFSSYGLNAKVLHIPGHSKGSIGILSDDRKLFCGDFAYNLPGFRFIDSLDDHRMSMNKIRKLEIDTVYPGHGKPFPMSVLQKRTM